MSYLAIHRQKHLPHKLHSQPHLPMETTSYGKAWRAFRKQNFGLFNHLLLDCAHYMYTNTDSSYTIAYCCKEVSLERYLADLSYP